MPHCASRAAVGFGVEKMMFKINTVIPNRTLCFCMLSHSHSCTTAWIFCLLAALRSAHSPGNGRGASLIRCSTRSLKQHLCSPHVLRSKNILGRVICDAIRKAYSGQGPAIFSFSRVEKLDCKLRAAFSSSAHQLS